MNSPQIYRVSADCPSPLLPLPSSELSANEVLLYPVRTLVHVSDLHFGTIDSPVAEALTPYLLKINHDVMVVSGDFTQRGTAGQYQDAMKWLAQFPAPKLCVPGNHDVPLYAVWERAVAPFRRYRWWVTDELAPVWEDEELLVLGVATPRAFVPVRRGFWKDGVIRERQLGHVVARAAAAPGKCCVVVTHHPFAAPPGHRPDGIVLGQRRVLPVLAANGVDVLLAGHLHASYHAEIVVETKAGARGMLSVQAGTATSFRRRHHPDGREYPNAFNVLRCSRERVEVEVHAYEQGRWGVNSWNASVRVGGRWVAAEADQSGASGQREPASISGVN